MQIGPKMATLQEKNQKNGQKHFFSKIPQDFELLKQVPQYSHQTGPSSHPCLNFIKVSLKFSISPHPG